MSRRNATFWSKVGETGVGEMGVGEQGISRLWLPRRCWRTIRVRKRTEERRKHLLWQ